MIFFKPCISIAKMNTKSEKKRKQKTKFIIEIPMTSLNLFLITFFLFLITINIYSSNHVSSIYKLYVWIMMLCGKWWLVIFIFLLKISSYSNSYTIMKYFALSFWLYYHLFVHSTEWSKSFGFGEWVNYERINF